MKNLKKVLALVLAFAMAFTMMATAGAAYTDSADIQATEAVDMLSALDIMAGDPDGSFRPNDTITRAEACRMIYSIRTNSDNADAYKDMQTTFTDVPADAWYAGYVKHCQAAGIVSGTSATTFEPTRDVTGVELALMCLRVMGYDPAKADIGGSTWSTKTISLATEAGILDDVNTTITAACPRQWAAQIMFNMLDADTVRWSDDANGYVKDTKYVNGNTSLVTYITVGEKYMQMTKSVGVITAMSKDTLTLTQSTSDYADSTYRVQDPSFTKVPVDYSDLMGKHVKVMVKDAKSNQVVGIYETEDNSSLTVNQSAIDVDGTDKIKVDGQSYKLEDTVSVYADGAYSTKYTSSSSFKNQQSPNVLTFVDTDGDSKFDVAVVKTYTVAKVTYASSTQIIAGGKTYKHSDENIAADLARDDFVVITENLYNDNKDIVKADVITGTLSATKGNPITDYQIGDTWYKAAADRTELNTVKATNEVEAVAVNGVMFYIKKTTGNKGAISDVALVVNKGTGVNNRQVKLAFFDGSTKVVDFDSDSTVTWTNLTEGNVYEYSISSNEYSFEMLNLQADYFGDYTAIDNGSDDSATGVETNVVNFAQNSPNTNPYTITNGVDVSTGTTAQWNNATSISDDAQVLLYDFSNDGSNKSSKLITGKQYKALTVGAAAGNVANKGGIAAFTYDDDGVTRVGAMAVAVRSIDSVATNTTHNYYAMIVEDAATVGSNTISYKIWNGTDTVTVTERKNSTVNRDMGQAIGYNSIDENNVIDDVATVGTVGAIKGVTSNGSKVTFDESTQQNITGDTTVLYVNTDEEKAEDIGKTSGSVVKASKSGNIWLNNAIYVTEQSGLVNDDDLDLLIVDLAGKMKGAMAEKTVSTTPSTSGSATVQFEASEDVVAGDTMNLVVTGKAGTTVQVTLTNAVFASNNKTTRTITIGASGREVVETIADGAGNVSIARAVASDVEYAITYTTPVTTVTGEGKYAGTISLSGAEKVGSTGTVEVTVAATADASATASAVVTLSATSGTAGTVSFTKAELISGESKTVNVTGITQNTTISASAAKTAEYATLTSVSLTGTTDQQLGTGNETITVTNNNDGTATATQTLTGFSDGVNDKIKLNIPANTTVEITNAGTTGVSKGSYTGSDLDLSAAGTITFELTTTAANCENLVTTLTIVVTA
ncbi:MAG: S-layer homology domain-containing protein [Butyricicoccus sp.]|nr:S-layer homology domain-containing protein [Butyricicoccus sp.]